MAKKRWEGVLSDLIAAYRSGQYRYFYGAKDIVLTNDTMTYLFGAEPGYFSRYSKAEQEQIRKNCLNSRGVDCSGLSGWKGTGDKQWSTGQINNCSQHVAPSQALPGYILYTTWNGTGRHVGVCLGKCDGILYAIQAGWEPTDNNLKLGRANIIVTRVSDTAWEVAGASNAVDYTGVGESYAPAEKLIREIFGGRPTKTPAWVAEATTTVNVRTSPEILNDRNGVARNPLKEWPLLGPGNLVDVCDDSYVAGWYYCRIAGKYYGWVKADFLKPPAPKPLDVGDKVKFKGTKIYASSYKNGKGVAVPAFDAKITRKDGVYHPFHIKATGTSGYEGWANEADLVRK